MNNDVGAVSMRQLDATTTRAPQKNATVAMAAPPGLQPQEASGEETAANTAVRPTADVSQAQDSRANREALEDAIASMQEYVQVAKRELEFQVDDSTGRTLVRVIDSESGDVIRQLPPEAVIAAADALADFATERSVNGLLLDAQA